MLTSKQLSLAHSFDRLILHVKLEIKYFKGFPARLPTYFNRMADFIATAKALFKDVQQTLTLQVDREANS